MTWQGSQVQSLSRPPSRPLDPPEPSADTPMTARQDFARRRTFAIISHPDAGKTTLTEKLLLFGGAIQLAGEVKAKANRRQTRSDWMDIERERGISVVTSVMTFEYDGCVFNLLDTPGHEDFSEDTYRTLSRGQFGHHGDRRRQGHRGADQEAVRGLPAARHPDRHLHQQARPRGRAIPSNSSRRSRRRWPSTPRRSPGRSASGRTFAGVYDLEENAIRRLDAGDAAPVPVADARRRRPSPTACRRAIAADDGRGDRAGQGGLPAVRPRRRSARAI